MNVQNQTASDTQLPARFPVGISDFKQIATGNYRFVDKSEFIKDVMDDGASAILITRPRRFGKTLNMSMLSYFLNINGLEEDLGLFDSLVISKHEAFCQKHQQKYPVIFVSFKGVKELLYDNAYARIIGVMKDLYDTHRYLMNDLSPEDQEDFRAILGGRANSEQIQNAIKRLSRYLQSKFGKQAVILIDEYDTPIQSAYLNKYYDQIIPLMRGILGEALKDNHHLHKGVITGISRVSQESLFSGVNNLEVYSLLRNDYSQYFGFSQEEVAELRRGVELESTLEQVKEWYNGYRIGERMMYNPWSIIKCFKNDGKLEPYWFHTSGNELIARLFAESNAATRGHFELLLQGQTIEKPLMENLVFPLLEKQESAIWSLLLYAGYLNVLSSKRRGFQLMAQVAVPNVEVMFTYDEIISHWFTENIGQAAYDTLLRSLVEGNVELFKKQLSEYLMQTGSCFDFNTRAPEQVFHAFMLGLVVGLKPDYIIDSNAEAGLGRLDMVLVPKDKIKNPVGILLEFKACKEEAQMLAKANEALQQIKANQYMHLLKQHGVKEILAVGMAFYGKQIKLICEKTLEDQTKLH